MRKIPVQYAKRVVGRKIYGGQSTHIPLRVNSAGVMPIIFAQSIMFIPSSWPPSFPKAACRRADQRVLDAAGADVSRFSTFLLIVFFTYFYTAIVLNPVDLADNMKKNGGFIPGIRPGKQTSDFIDFDSVAGHAARRHCLALIAVLPTIIVSQFNAVL